MVAVVGDERAIGLDENTWAGGGCFTTRGARNAQDKPLYNDLLFMGEDSNLDQIG